MNSRFCFILFIILSYAGCKEKSYTSDIPKEDLLNIILDISIAAQAIDSHNDLERDSVREIYREQIAEIHGIPMVEIERNLLLLQSENPAYYKELNDTVIVRIENIERKLNNIRIDKLDKN